MNEKNTTDALMVEEQVSSTSVKTFVEEMSIADELHIHNGGGRCTAQGCTCTSYVRGSDIDPYCYRPGCYHHGNLHAG